MATDCWSEAKCLRLIREFRERPILWDQKCPLFYKKGIKLGAWDEIGEELEVAPELCRRKMCILMSSFRREKVKYMHNLEKNPYMQFTSTWFAFNAMSFMLDKDRERKQKLSAFNYEDDSETDTDEEKTPTTTTEQYPVEKLPWYKISDKRDMHPRKYPKNSVNDEILLRSPSEQLPTTSQTNENEMNFFSNFIASKMMRYSEKTKNAVQQAICQIIFKADEEQMQEPNETCARSREPQSSASRPLLAGTSLLPGCRPVTELNTEHQPGDVSIKVYCSDSD